MYIYVYTHTYTHTSPFMPRTRLAFGVFTIVRNNFLDVYTDIQIGFRVNSIDIDRYE